MLRDNITENEAKIRINAQHEDNFYIEKSDFVIYNENSPDFLESRVSIILCEVQNGTV